MRTTLHVARDLLREALARKWVLGLLVGITLVLTLLGLFLRLDVVDGAISGSKLFGAMLFDDIVSTDKVMRPIYMVAAGIGFFGGALFLAIACSDFAPSLLSPGRIEHLLSLPVSRWQLLLGTYLGVLALSILCTGYGALGITLVFGFKTGFWTTALLAGSALGVAGFCALYAAMLTSAFFVRSAAASSAVGILTLVMGILSSNREAIENTIEPGVGRTLFHYGVQPFPRLWKLAEQSIRLAGDESVNAALAGRLVAGSLIFSLGMLAIAAWRFEKKDF
jgi:ABC-type transport system involved in multi-copper enzyme maturation permease subunit